MHLLLKMRTAFSTLCRLSSFLCHQIRIQIQRLEDVGNFCVIGWGVLFKRKAHDISGLDDQCTTSLVPVPTQVPAHVMLLGLGRERKRRRRNSAHRKTHTAWTGKDRLRKTDERERNTAYVLCFLNKYFDKQQHSVISL